MYMKNNTLKNSILRRVYAIWFLKKITQPFYVKMYITILLLWQFIGNVSVINVFKNMPPNNVGGSFIFFENAFLGTEIFVQAIILGSIILVLFVVRGLFRGEQSLKIA